MPCRAQSMHNCAAEGLIQIDCIYFSRLCDKEKYPPMTKKNRKAAKPVELETLKKKQAKVSRKKEPKQEPIGKEVLLSSKVVFQGELFRVLHDKLIEPGGKNSERDIIRHHGSVVILAIDNTKSKKNPWIVMERQYRHAALQYL